MLLLLDFHWASLDSWLSNWLFDLIWIKYKIEISNDYCIVYHVDAVYIGTLPDRLGDHLVDLYDSDHFDDR